jgi:tetratricopeptide (TPR) repeat protein
MVSVRARILACLLLASVGVANAAKPQAWIEVRSPHFVVVSDANEKRARRVALQFELIRAVFQKSFPRARVDPVGQVTVLAARDEKSLKNLLPEFWEEKGQLHPDGIFVRGPEKNFVALRVDVPSEDAYHTIYHEYVHMLMSLNVPWLPTWLNEGIAEVYGNSFIGEKAVHLGRPSLAHLALLRQGRLLPLDVLLAVDHSSPYYNEADKASIFYAQSWALTHFLMLGDRMQHRQKLVEFVGLINNGMDQREALERTLGDLKTLDERLKAYIQQPTLGYVRIEPPEDIKQEEFTVRELPVAESDAVRGDFHLQSGRETEARALLEEALRLDPRVALAHESLGFFHYQRGEKEEAAEQFAEAVKLDSRSYLAHYYNALLTTQNSLDQESIALAEESLQRALELNPEFGYAAAALAGLYANQEDKLDQALLLATRAVELNPSEVSNYITLGHILLRLNRADEAQSAGQRALRAAQNPREESLAQSFLGDVQRAKEFRAEQKRTEAEDRAAQEKWDRLLEERRKSSPQRPREGLAGPGFPASEVEMPGANLRSRVEGRIIELSCAPTGGMKLTIELPSYKLELHADNFHQIEFLTGARNRSDSFDPCTQILGMKAQVTYAIDEPHAGEIFSIELGQ